MYCLLSEMSNILIYGCRKTGSTLTQRLLELEDYTFFPVETKIKSFKKFINLKNNSKINLEILRGHFPIKYNEKFKINEKIYNRYLLENYYKVLNLKDFITLHVEALEKAKNSFNKNFIIKEIAGDTKLLIDNFLSSFPNSKVVFIKRNPKFISKAVFTDRHRKKIRLTLKKKILEVIEPHIILSFIGHYKNNRNVYILNYENLISNVEDEIKKLCQFLNIKFLSKYTIPTLNGERTIVDTSSQKKFGLFKANKSLMNDVTLFEFFLILLSRPLALVYLLLYKAKLLNFFIKNKEFIKTL